MIDRLLCADGLDFSNGALERLAYARAKNEKPDDKRCNGKPRSGNKTVADTLKLGGAFGQRITKDNPLLETKAATPDKVADGSRSIQ